MRKVINQIKITFPSLSVNEATARAIVSAFCAGLDPTATDLADIKCAVSEAVTNCIVHAYRERVGLIAMTVELLENRKIRIVIKDKGCGIADVAAARQPLFTTDAEHERSGMGFTVMESFMDKLTVRSVLGRGTTVIMVKQVGTYA